MIHFLAVFLVFVSVPEENTSVGWNDFSEGRFEQAILRARSSGSADDLSLACRAGLTLAGYLKSGEEAVAALHSAAADCEAALKLNPTHLEASLSLALAIGYEGKRLGKPKFATTSRRLIERLVELYPEDPMPSAALGGWHGAVSNAGFLARTYLGGSKKKANEWFDHSRTLGHWDIALRFEYVKFLAMGGKSDRKQALKEIDQLLASEPNLAIDRMLQDRTRLLRTAVVDGRKRAIKKMVQSLTAFPGIKNQKNYPGYTFNESLWPGKANEEDQDVGGLSAPLQAARTTASDR